MAMKIESHPGNRVPEVIRQADFAWEEPFLLLVGRIVLMQVQ